MVRGWTSTPLFPWGPSAARCAGKSRGVGQRGDQPGCPAQRTVGRTPLLLHVNRGLRRIPATTLYQVLFDYYLEPALADDAAYIDASLAASDSVQQEDVALCEAVQRGLRSPAYDTGRWAL